MSFVEKSLERIEMVGRVVMYFIHKYKWRFSIQLLVTTSMVLSKMRRRPTVETERGARIFQIQLTGVTVQCTELQKLHTLIKVASWHVTIT